eukprot:Sdes_comp19258_c0_seq1m10239
MIASVTSAQDVAQKKIDLVRLFDRSYHLANNLKQVGSQLQNGSLWRLKKYLQVMKTNLVEIEALEDAKGGNLLKDFLNESRRKILFLSKILEDYQTFEELIPAATFCSSNAGEKLKADIFEKDAGKDGQNWSLSTEREIRIENQQAIQTKIREQLLGNYNHVEAFSASERGENGEKTGDFAGENGKNLHQRRNFKNDASEKQKLTEALEKNHVDVFLSHHRKQQENLTQEMIFMAQCLKSNAELAQNHIKQDLDLLDSTSDSMHSNMGKLRHQVGRLGEHVRNSGSFWIWMILFVVVVVFIWMILFLRFFPKRY